MLEPDAKDAGYLDEQRKNQAMRGRLLPSEHFGGAALSPYRLLGGADPDRLPPLAAALNPLATPPQR